MPNDIAYSRKLGPLTPLVGREPELKQLLDCWEQTRAGQGAFMLVRGEAGIGKSRLIQELRERVLSEGAVRLRCQCWVQFSSSAFYPVIELLQHMLRLVRHIHQIRDRTLHAERHFIRSNAGVNFRIGKFLIAVPVKLFDGRDQLALLSRTDTCRIMEVVDRSAR